MWHLWERYQSGIQLNFVLVHSCRLSPHLLRPSELLQGTTQQGLGAAHYMPVSKLPRAMKVPRAQLGIFTRCLNGVPTGTVYLGTKGPPGCCHLLRATGIGSAAPGKWAPLIFTFLWIAPFCEGAGLALDSCRHNRRAAFLPMSDFSSGWKEAENLSLSRWNFSSSFSALSKLYNFLGATGFLSLSFTHLCKHSQMCVSVCVLKVHLVNAQSWMKS